MTRREPSFPTVVPPRFVWWADPVNGIAAVRAEEVSGLTPIAMGPSADLQVRQKVVGSDHRLDSTAR